MHSLPRGWCTHEIPRHVYCTEVVVASSARTRSFTLGHRTVKKPLRHCVILQVLNPTEIVDVKASDGS